MVQDWPDVPLLCVMFHFEFGLFAQFNCPVTETRFHCIVAHMQGIMYIPKSIFVVYAQY